VSIAGLDVGQPAGARALYVRLRHAAIEVCGSGMRVDLEPSTILRAASKRPLARRSDRPICRS